MAKKPRLHKVVDVRSVVRCATGYGLIREEVWEDAHGNVARYNMAFINHLLTSLDHGRVLGYDNSHGYHHRHFKGETTPHKFTGYEELAARFLNEVDELRREVP